MHIIFTFYMLLKVCIYNIHKARTNQSQSQSQSQSYFTTGGLPRISSSWRKAPWDSGHNFFQLNTWGHSPHVTSSLTKGRVCHLQLLLVLASAVILGPSLAGLMTTFYCLRFETPPTWRARSPYLYAGLMTTFYCLRFETPPTWRARSPYLYSPGTGWLSYTPRHCIPFPSSVTTHRATAEVFDPATTRVCSQN
jgi:hypothetical protein